MFLDSYSSVAAIACLSEPGHQDLDNLGCLYNLHEKYLNNLVARHNEGLIPDFYEFFREAWAMAIFHDRFQEFVADLEMGVLNGPVRNRVGSCGAWRFI
eukprot:m.355780 g.355780  ORF g.355780 m.355780 type:complete len:99 (+) comp19926_c0_seq17:168-464(+)